MKKYSDFQEPKNTNKNSEDVTEFIESIIEKNLVVESENVDLSEHSLNIVGINQATEEIKEFFEKKFLQNTLMFVSEFKSNFAKNQFQYTESLIEKLENKLSSYERRS